MKSPGFRFIAVALVVACAAVAGARAAEPAAPPPVSAFFKHAAIGDARLSPSGRYLAIRTGAHSKRVLLAVVDLQGKGPPSIAANFADADIRSFEWVTDDRLVFNLVDLESGLGDQGFGPGLFSARRDGSELRQLIRTREEFLIAAAPLGKREALSAYHGLLDIPSDGSEEVIVGEYVFDATGELTSVNAKRLNAATGQTQSISGGRPDHTVEWLFDSKGTPRAVGTRYHGQSEAWWRDAPDTPWRKLGVAASNSFTLRFIDADGRLYVATREGRAQTSSLARYDFAADRPDPTAFVATPGFDFAGSPILDVTSGRMLGVRVRTDADTTVWFDAKLKQLQQLADARFPGRINELTCHRCDAPDVVLVFSYSDQDPGNYWIYRPPTGAWEPVGAVRPEIDPRQMARLDFQRIKARDGEDLPVWVTARPRPPNAPPPPAVVLVHGGPWVRGTNWRWDAEAQFLASRGYTVIEPEYRGSTGFGRRHYRLGFKQWGGTMQDDVADAVNWAAAKGIVDARQVCIAGASYGGYATLMGLIRFPEMYRCGVAWVAVTDPRLLFEDSWASDSTDEVRQYTLPERIGDPVKDAAMLSAASPVLHAADIRAPLLLAFGRDDRRVPLEHGTRIREALHAVGRDPQFVVYDGEAHGWLKTDNEVDWWTRVERFLDRNLHGGEPPQARE